VEGEAVHDRHRPSSSRHGQPVRRHAGGRCRSWTASPSTPTRTTRASRGQWDASEHLDDRPRGLTRSSSRLSAGIPGRLLCSRSGTTNSASSRRSRRRSSPLRGTEPATTKTCPRGDAGRATTGRPCSSPFCQPNVDGLFLFPLRRRDRVRGLAVGLYYPDGAPKSSIAAVKLALDESRRAWSLIADDLELSVQAEVAQRGPMLTLTCDIDCSYVAELYRLPGRAPRHEAWARDRRQADGTAVARPETEREVQAPTVCSRTGESGAAHAAARAAAARVASRSWRASTSRTPSSASIRRGGGADRGAPGSQGCLCQKSSRTSQTASTTSRAYMTTGVRPDTDFFLWKITDRYEALGELGAALNATPLAGWLRDARTRTSRRRMASQYTNGAAGAANRATGLPLSRRVPLREATTVVRAARGGPPPRDGRAHHDRA